MCKKCQSERTVKSGIVRGKQRYQCKDCGYNFVLGDGRTNERVAAKKAMCVLLYSLGQTPMTTLSKALGTWPSLVCRWVHEAEAQRPAGESSRGVVSQMAFDEMRRFVEVKKETFRATAPLTVASGELWPGCPALVIVQTPEPVAQSR
jgi:transposase